MQKLVKIKERGNSDLSEVNFLREQELHCLPEPFFTQMSSLGEFAGKRDLVKPVLKPIHL